MKYEDEYEQMRKYEQRCKEAVYDAMHPKTEIVDPYMSGYRAGWNDALRQLNMIAGPQIVSALTDTANSLGKK